MTIKLVLLDLDGTLLTGDKRMTDRTRTALERAAEKGVQIVPATGRFYRGIPESVRALDFIRYAVCMNGAQVYDVWERRTLHRAEIPLPLAERVFRLAGELDVLYDCFLDGHGYMPRACYERIDEYIADGPINAMVKSLREPVDDFLGFVRGQGKALQKTQMFFRDMALRERMLARLPGMFPELAVTTALPNNIEMNIAAATKENALRFLCGHLGLDISQTMACGDGANDVGMIRAAGLGVAMENAAPEVLAAADTVTASNDADGAALALERFCL